MSNVQDLLQQRYFREGEETWDDVIDRVVNHLFALDTTRMFREEAREVMLDKKFIPSSPILMNTGSRYPMLCSCFVLDVPDNIPGIMRTLTETVMIQKYGGGVGINYSNIRPEGSLVSSTGGKASGPVSFMGFWNAGMDIIRQAGKRQGAMMGVLDVYHPDLPHFLRAKTVEGELTNFNLSVGLNREFMDNYLNGGEVERDILFAIAEAAWSNGEPGVLYLDNINAGNPYGIPIRATNPCGEVPLPPNGACDLGSINLVKHLEWKRGKSATMNWEELKKTVRLGVFILNRALDTTWWPTAATAAFASAYRPIGIGVMGLADALALMGYSYIDERGREATKQIMQFIMKEARWYSSEYRRRFGVGFNRTLMAIAPTGSIAMFAGCNYSIEPFFSFAYTKKVEAGIFDVNLRVFLDEVADQWGYTFTEQDWESIASTGSVQYTGAPKGMKRLLLTANEIPARHHLSMQAEIQSVVDSSVSKTVNLPSDTSVEEVAQIILDGWYMGLKGLTVYRNKSREVEVISCASGTCQL